MTYPAYSPAVTDRAAPLPWALCEGCGKHAALALPGDHSPYCPVCARREALRDAATRSLAQLLAPHLGAWGNHWAAAGLSLTELHEVVEHAGGAWANDAYEGRLQRAMLRRAMSNHPAPQNVEQAAPDRVEVNALTLPRVTACYPSPYRLPGEHAPAAGEPDSRYVFSLAYPDGRTAEGVSVYPGPDAVLFYPSGPQGDAVLYYTGIHGQTAPRGHDRHFPALIPAQFAPRVRAALGFWGSAGVEQ